MLFTLTDRNYNVLDAYETDDYLIGIYTGYIIKTLDLNISVDDDRVSNWIAGAYIFCKDSEGHTYWFTIRTVEEGAYKDNKTITAYSGTLDILNEDANPVTRPSEAQPFSYYFDKIFYDTGIELGVNEIEGMNRTLEFTSENASNVEMLQYVLNGFDNAEGDLVVDMVGSVPTKVSLNVYKRIGRESSQALVTDQDDSLTELSRMSTIEELATCLNPVGENEGDVDNPITLVGKYYEELDENGDVLYYSPENDARVYSVKGREKFFVKLPNKNNGEFDGYINRRYVSEAKTQDALWSASLARLKKIDNVQVEYEVKGDINCRAGDNVTIVSHQMKPPVMLSARVMEYKFNDDDPSRNEYTFGNYQELESQIGQLAQIMAEIKKSIITVTSQITAYALSDDGVEPPVTGWSEGYTEPSVGKWLWTRIITRLSNGNETTAYSVSRIGEVTFTNDNPPVNPKESDKWYKETVDDTEYLIYIDGTWQPITSKAEIDNITRDVENAISEAEAAKQAAENAYNDALADAKAHAEAEDARIRGELESEIGGAIDLAEQAKQDAIDKADQALADAKAHADAEILLSNQHFDGLIEDTKTEVAAAQSTADSAVEQIDTAVVNSGFTSLDDTLQNISSIASGVKSELDTAIENAGFTSLDDTIKNMNLITMTAEQSAQQAITDASNAYDLAQTSISEAQTAQANSLTALGKADNALDGVSTLDVRVNDVEDELALKADNTFMTEDGELVTLSNAITFNANRFSSDMKRIESRVESLAGEINLVVVKGAFEDSYLLGGEAYPTPTKNSGSVGSDTMGEKIQVEPNETLALSKNRAGDNTWRINFYYNGGYVSRMYTAQDEYILTIPNSVNEIWVSYPRGSQPQIVRGTEFVPYRANLADQMTTNEVVMFRNEYDEFADRTERRLTAVDSSDGRLAAAELLITQTANGLSLKADQTTVNELTGEVETLGTEFDAVAGQVSSKVWNTDIETAIDGVGVGGRNLFSLYDYQEQEKETAVGSTYMYAFQGEPFTKYTLSTDIPSGDLYDVFFDPHPSSPASHRNGVSKGQPRTVTTDDTGLLDIFLRYGSAAVAIDTDVIEGRYHVQLERGSKATDWSPAPEDTVAEIEHIETEWTQTFNSFEQTIIGEGGINTQLQTLENSLSAISDPVTGRLTIAEQNLDGFRNEVYNSDGSSKITQLATGLSSVVSDFNSLDTTGWNLMRNTRYFIGVKQHGPNYKTTVEEGTDPYGNQSPLYRYTPLSNSSYLRFDNVVEENDVDYTFSAWMKRPNGTGGNYPVRISIGSNIENSKTFTLNSEEWTKVELTGVRKGFSFVHIEVDSSFMHIHMFEPKVEKGSSATPWLPHPDEVANRSQITQLSDQINITISGIDGRVTTQETTLDTISSTVSGHGERLTTVEQTAQGLQSTVADKANQSQVTQLATGLNVLTQSRPINLLPNGSFADGFTGWTAGENVAFYSVSDEDGVKFARMYHSRDDSTTTGNLNRFWQGASMEPNTRYRITFHARAYGDGREISVGQVQGEMDKIPLSTTRRQYEVIYEAVSTHAFSIFLHAGGTYEIGNIEVHKTTAITSSQISALNNNINLRVEKGDVLSQINIEAGRTLIQSNSLVLDGNTIVKGDFGVSGSNVTLNANTRVQGDFTVRGGNVTLDGNTTVLGDFAVLGENIILDGNTTVLDNFTVTGGNIILDGNTTVHNDFTVTGGNVVLDANTRVQGDFTVSGGNVILDGNTVVRGGFTVLGENVTLDANTTVLGEFKVLGGNVTLDGNTTVLGDFSVFGKNITLDGDTIVTGDFTVAGDIVGPGIDADNITVGTLDATNVNIINLNASEIVGLNSEFVKSAWNGINTRINIDATALTASDSEGNQAIINTSGEIRSTAGGTDQTRGILHKGRLWFHTTSGSAVLNIGAHPVVGEGVNRGSIATARAEKLVIGRYNDYLNTNPNAKVNPYITLEYSATLGDESNAFTKVWHNLSMSGKFINDVQQVSGYELGVRSTYGRLMLGVTGYNTLQVGQANTRSFGNIEMQPGYEVTQASDRRWKDIVGKTETNALEEINKLSVVDYYWKNGDGEKQFGLIAQDSPFLSVRNEDGYYGISGNKLAMLNLLSSQELCKRIEALEEEIKLLKSA